jgi:hypothetical protein
MPVDIRVLQLRLIDAFGRRKPLHQFDSESRLNITNRLDTIDGCVHARDQAALGGLVGSVGIFGLSGDGWCSMRSIAGSRQAHAGALALQMFALGLIDDGSCKVPARTTVKFGRPEESENR